MKVYTVLDLEPPETAAETLFMPPEPPILYATREQAEEAAKEYNEEFHDSEPAIVVEVDVVEPHTQGSGDQG